MGKQGRKITSTPVRGKEKVGQIRETLIRSRENQTIRQHEEMDKIGRNHIYVLGTCDSGIDAGRKGATQNAQTGILSGSPMRAGRQDPHQKTKKRRHDNTIGASGTGG